MNGIRNGQRKNLPMTQESTRRIGVTSVANMGHGTRCIDRSTMIATLVFELTHSHLNYHISHA